MLWTNYKRGLFYGVEYLAGCGKVFDSILNNCGSNGLQGTREHFRVWFFSWKILIKETTQAVLPDPGDLSTSRSTLDDKLTTQTRSRSHGARTTEQTSARTLYLSHSEKDTEQYYSRGKRAIARTWSVCDVFMSVTVTSHYCIMASY